MTDIQMPSSILNYKSYDPYLELPNSHSHRKYDLVFFPSGLRCLLISDSSSHMVAASMTVGCGSFNDPDEIHGLAHLCEHLIVLGGPQKRLRQVVSNSGGLINAYTGSDQTSFAFEISSYVKVDPNKDEFILDSMLPIFATYFSKLKYQTASISSEIKAVHEEQMLNTSNKEKMLWHGLRLLASKNHPFSRFATGNSSTLSKAPIKMLKSKLALYHSQNFLPGNMALVIKGPQSINHLKKVAVKNFSTIYDMPSKRQLQCSDFSGNPKYRKVFDFSQENVLFIKCEESPRIRLCFPMTHDDEVVPIASQTMLYNIIGNESVDSLCYVLKKKTQFAENVFVHTQEISKENNVLFIDIEATNHGMKRVLLVLNIVLNFIEKTLLEIPNSELDSVIKEYQVVEKIQFQNKKIPSSLLEEIVSYSEFLEQHENHFESMIKGYIEEKTPDSKEIKRILGNFLCREKLILQIMDANFTSQYQFSDSQVNVSKDEYFGFEYGKIKYDFSELPKDQEINPKVSMPIGDLSKKISPLLESKPQQHLTKYRDLKTTKEIPQIWCSEENLEIWTHKLGNSGEVEVSVHIKFAEVFADAATLVALEIMASIVGEKLQFMLYNLETLGCTWGIYVNVNGEPSLMITASGPRELASQVLSLMFLEVVSCLGSMGKCSYQELKRARVLLRRTYEEYVNSSGVKLVFVLASMIFDEGLVSPQERIKALELIDIESISLLGNHILTSQTIISTLISGDITDKGLTEIREKCKMIPSQSPKKVCLHPESSYLIPTGESYLLEIKGPPGDPLTVVYYYIQIGERSNLRNFTMARLVELVISAFAFDDLRMKRNLAYGVFTGMRMFKKTFGIHITVPTGQHSCEFIVEQIEEFLTSLEQTVDGLSPAQFQKLVSDLVDSVEEPAGEDAATSNLFFNLQPVNGSSSQGDEDEHQLHWNNMEQILNKTYNYGGKGCQERLDTEVLEKVTLEKFCRFFHLKVGVNSPSRSAVAICKKADEISREKKVQFISKILLEKLQEANLPISEELLVEELELCEDLENLKDLDLERHFTGIGPKIRYQKFRVKLKLGGMLKKYGTRQARGSGSENSKTRKAFKKLEDIQRKCTLVR